MDFLQSLLIIGAYLSYNSGLILALS